MGLHLAAALKVLFNGLPPPKTEIKTVVEHVPLGEPIDMFTTEEGYYSRSGPFFRSCKEAFDVCGTGRSISKLDAIALADGRFIMARNLTVFEFYKPPKPDPA